MICHKLLHIQGRVQKVGYRAWTASQATKLGLYGWVKNKEDGSVEAYIEGDSELVARMIEFCSVGPPFAKVTKIEVVDSQPQDTAQVFQVLR